MSKAVTEGDVIKLTGYAVPIELRDKYFKVEVIMADGTLQVGMPFEDATLTLPSGWEYKMGWHV